MENKYLKNKIILKYCKDYFRIINEKFTDSMSDKVIGIYQEFIFEVDPRDKTKLKKAIILNDALVKYFDDSEFKKQLSGFLKKFKVAKGTEDIISPLVNAIISEYATYKEGYTRNLYIPRWI